MILNSKVMTSFLRSLHCSSANALPVQVKNHYVVLGVDRNASKEEIKEAFVKLSKKYHPDLNPGLEKSSSQAFIEVSEAYQVLIDSKKRNWYNSQLHFAESARTHHEQAFHGNTSTSQRWPSESPYYNYHPGRGHSDHFSAANYETAVRNPNHSGVMYTLLILTALIPAFLIFRVGYIYRNNMVDEKYRRNAATYSKVREKAKSSSMQETLDALVKHSEAVRAKYNTGKPIK